MSLMKIFLKILVLPFMLVVGAFSMIVKAVTNLSCYIVGPFMLFLAGCIVYAIVMQLWSQVAILTVLLAGCLLVLFSASWLIVALENIQMRIKL